MIQQDNNIINHNLSPLLNFFFCDEAAASLPKMKADVCLSAPVVFEMELEFAKTICDS